MESHTSLAEDLPALYRAILDGVAELEHSGHRREAAVARAEATQVYSSSWDEAGLRRLGQIRQRIDRLLIGTERPRREKSRGWRVGKNVASPQGGRV